MQSRTEAAAGVKGLPVLGETLEFFTRSPSLELPAFLKRRLHRYGPVFRTNIVGQDLIVSLDPEVNNYVLQQEGKLFQMWYPDSVMRVFGADNIVTAMGPLHKLMRNMVLRFFGPENLRQAILCEVQKTAQATLLSWLDQPSIEFKEAVSSGRKNIMKILKELFDERRKKASDGHESIDFIDVLLDELKEEKPALSKKTALDLIFLLLFASFETTASMTTAVLTFLTHNHKALQELAEEHDYIQKTRADPNSEITWEEYKSMKFTSHVIHEALRLANIAPGMFRKAIEDVHLKGFDIPKGSKIMICPSAVHLNPMVYKDPNIFNPWRWKDNAEPVGGASKDFMAFGAGLRLCVGTDLAKMQIAIFLHCLVTKYRWKAIKGGTMVLSPGLRFPEGFHIQLLPKP